MPEDLRKMSLYDLCLGYADADGGENGLAIYTELCRRDEATAKLVEAARFGLARIESDIESEANRCSEGEALRKALAEFEKI